MFLSGMQSDIMRHVKSSDNRSTEESMIAFLKGHGLKGWQRNYKIYEKLDFIFRKQKTAVFLDGCFWHGHDCRNTRPAQNAEYWQKKRARNMARDADVTAHLEKLGWTVIRVWECELKKKSQMALWERLQPKRC